MRSPADWAVAGTSGITASSISAHATLENVTARERSMCRLPCATVTSRRTYETFVRRPDDRCGSKRAVHERRGADRARSARAEGRRYGARLYAAGDRRSDLHLVEAARKDRRPRVVSQGLHRWLNGRMQSAP